MDDKALEKLVSLMSEQAKKLLSGREDRSESTKRYLREFGLFVPVLSAFDLVFREQNLSVGKPVLDELRELDLGKIDERYAPEFLAGYHTLALFDYLREDSGMSAKELRELTTLPDGWRFTIYNTHLRMANNLAEREFFGRAAHNSCAYLGVAARKVGSATAQLGWGLFGLLGIGTAAGAAMWYYGKIGPNDLPNFNKLKHPSVLERESEEAFDQMRGRMIFAGSYRGKNYGMIKLREGERPEDVARAICPPAVDIKVFMNECLYGSGDGVVRGAPRVIYVPVLVIGGAGKISK